MSTKSAKSVVSRTSAASGLGSQPKPKPANTLQKASKPLRKEVLVASTVVGTSTPAPEIVVESPLPSEASDFEAVFNQDAEAWSDASGAAAGDTTGRESLLPSRNRRVRGAAMNLATIEANEMLLRGKEALENCRNIRSDLKAEALECLERLYEVVLSLSDSRSRNICNLEREKARHARELVFVERAHGKQITELQATHAAELQQARSDISNTLNTARAIKAWLDFEMDGPFKAINQTRDGVLQLTESGRSSKAQATQSCQQDPALSKEIATLSARVLAISGQLDSLRRQLETTEKRVETGRERSMSPPKPVTSDPRLGDICEGLAAVRSIVDNLDKRPLCEPLQVSPVTECRLREIVSPIETGVGRIQAEVSAISEAVERTRAEPPHLNIELALADVKESVADLKKEVQGGLLSRSYAQVTKMPGPAKPAHTLIVSPTDPHLTSDQVVKRLEVALDTKSTGIRVDRCRKAANRKVVLSCSSREDILKISSSLEKGGHDLEFREAESKRPLACIRNVLAYHSDQDVKESLLKQNNHLLQGTDSDPECLRIIYRRKARNPLECHVIVELLPCVWKRFLEAGKVYIGLQRCPIVDQSPLVQCAGCLEYGHTKKVCKETAISCSHCGGAHKYADCPAKPSPAVCINCTRAGLPEADRAHNAFNGECPIRQKWDSIARSRVAYC